MIQFKILSGKQAGSTVVARRFPFRIGRAQNTDLSLDEPGVWDQHVAIQFEPGEGFVASSSGEALMTINGQAAKIERLRNGDTIEIGGARIQFGLVGTAQSSRRILDGLVWAGIALVSLVQILLIYLLVS
jgi:pSer/pThr/pTyr-binding forkhead associated (FHA) protein